MNTTKKVTTKRICRGEYEVYVNGVFAGTITNGSTENNKEWAGFDENNEWIGTVETKRYCLEFCFS